MTEEEIKRDLPDGKEKGMVVYLLGNYLVESGRLTEEQLQKAIAKQNEVRVKMGLLAVAEGMMTSEQAEEVNRLQATMDKRFGDIAVEKGYLTDEQIGNLLKMQGNAYMSFAQVLVDEGFIGLQELDTIMDDFQQKNGFTRSAMEDLKSDDPERVVPLFLPPEAMAFSEIASIVVKTLIRCVDRNVYIGKATLQDEVKVNAGAFQKTVDFSAPVDGYVEVELGITEVNGGLSKIATIFCKEEETLDKEDMLDASGELLNCISGLCATALSRKGIDSELLPPVHIEDSAVMTGQGICSIPVFVGKEEAVFTIIGRK